ncbi:MAG TPA: plastocyanin/azurin family copper-binding protein [Acidimicrobiia bacterium]|nr:plastocyanin/azurin family copper-binding protein [Acidimicrobiia bacterium]
MTRALGAIVLLAFAVAGVAACGSSKPKAVPIPPPADLRGRKQVEIDAKDNQFTPAAVIVDAGTKVTWRNTDTVAHNVEKSADAVDFGAEFGADASVFGPGETYSFTFRTPGTYFYTCTIHTLMTGKVQVVAK